MSKNLRIAIIGSRGYPIVYSGYETLVKELSERLVESGNEVTVYCHRKLFNEKPRKVNGINLIYTPSINSKFFSQLYNSFFSFVHDGGYYHKQNITLYLVYYLNFLFFNKF